MARKKKVDKPAHEQLEDLADELSKNNIPDDILNGDLRDACDTDADMAYEEITESVLLDKITFLWIRGWQIGRIKEIVEQELEDNKNG